MIQITNIFVLLKIATHPRVAIFVHRFVHSLLDKLSLFKFNPNYGGF